SCTAADHLSQPEARSRAHEFFGNIFCLSGKNVFGEPVLQIEVVGKSPEQSHGNVGVAVNETGSNNLTGGVDALGGGIHSRDVSAGADGDDATAFNGNAGVLYHAPIAVHGYQS